MEKTYSVKEKYSFLLGLFGQNILYYIVMSSFSYNLQSVIFLPALAVSSILLIGQILDGVNDPIFGSIVDRTNTKWGKCRPYIMFCTPVIAVFTVLLFVNGTYSSDNSMLKNIMIITWAVGAFIIWGIVYSLCDVPIWSLPNLMTENESDRSKLMGSAKIVATFGVGVSLLILPVSQMIGQIIAKKIGSAELGLKYGILLTVIVLTMIGAIFLQITGLITREHVKSPSHKNLGFKSSMSLMWKCKPYRQLFVSRFICSLSGTMDIVSVTLYSYYYGNNGSTNYIAYLLVFSISSFLGQYLSFYIVPKLIQQYEKHIIYNFGCIQCCIFCLLYFGVYLIAPTKLDSVLFVIILCIINVFIGIGNGTRQLVQSIMVADTVDYEEYYHGFRPDGIFTSGQLIVTKISTGIGSLITGIVFAIVGFSSDKVRVVNEALFLGTDFKTAPEFSSYRFAMFFLFTIPAAIGFLLSVIPMRRYILTNDSYMDIHKKLLLKREEQNGYIQ